jgi:putative transposase
MVSIYCHYRVNSARQALLTLTPAKMRFNMHSMRPANEKTGPSLIFLATATREMMPIFALEALARQAILQLGRVAAESGALIYGYALIPSSLQLMVGFPGKYDLAAFMYKYKWLSSRAIVALDHGEFHERLYRQGKFKPWMNRFDNLMISSKKQFESRLNYIHNEPVRKGFVSDPAEWEFSSAGCLKTNRPGLIKVENDLSIFRLE